MWPLIGAPFHIIHSDCRVPPCRAATFVKFRASTIQCIVWLVGRSVGRSVRPSVCRWVGRSVGGLVGRSVGRSVGRWVGGWVGGLVGWLVGCGWLVGWLVGCLFYPYKMGPPNYYKWIYHDLSLVIPIYNHGHG